MSIIATDAPSRANSRAVAAPMPDAPPVTIATRPALFIVHTPIKILWRIIANGPPVSQIGAIPRCASTSTGRSSSGTLMSNTLSTDQEQAMKFGCCAPIENAEAVYRAGFDYLEAGVTSLIPDEDDASFAPILEKYQ